MVLKDMSSRRITAAPGRSPQAAIEGQAPVILLEPLPYLAWLRQAMRSGLALKP
jgi:hypothetical protein